MAGRSVDTRFPGRMRELLEQRGMSYRALAARTFHAKSYLHDLATGRKAPTADVARRIDDALGAGGRLAALVTPEIDSRPSARDTDDVHRRTLIMALASIGIGHALPTVDARTPDTTTVESWREAAWEYGYDYLAAPRTELLTDLSGDLATLMTIIDRTSGGTARSGLSDTAARLAALTAMCCVDLGYRREARHAWRLARRLADESESADARQWVRGQEATFGPYSGRPLPVALAVADEGMAINPRSRSTGMASLTAARAQVLALLGRRDEAVEALHSTEEVFTGLPADVTADNSTIANWTEHRLRHARSFVYSVSGTASEAHRAQDQALTMYAPARVISRAQVQMHRAVSVVRDGDIPGGLQHAGEVLASLPGRARGNLVLALADTVLAAIPNSEQRRPAVVEYREHLDSIRRAPVGANA